MPRALNRLRWQLTLSHLVAIGVTLVSLIAAVLLIGSLWWARASRTSAQPVDDARVVASSIQSLVLRDVRDSANVSTSAELSSTLRQLVSGDVRVFVGGQWPTEAARDRQPSSSLLDNVAYLAIVGADGRTLASSEPAGAAFAPAERDAWTPLVDAALTGTTDSARLVAFPGREGPAAIGAYPVMDAGGQPVA